MCMLTEPQRRQVYLRCNAIPLQKLVELCMNPISGITIEGLREAGYHKVDKLAELCHNKDVIERNLSECNASEALEKEWNSIIQMPDNVEKIECLNKLIERLYLYDSSLAYEYRKKAERYIEEQYESGFHCHGEIVPVWSEWLKAEKENTIQGYNRFISLHYPDEKYQIEAKKRIHDMETLLDDIKRNPYNYGREKMYDIISKHRLSKEDLVDNYGILSDRAYEHIRRYPLLKDEQRELPISRMEKPYSKDGSVDVIFWGLPGAGVTCLLSGLLGLAGQLGFNFNPRGPGGGGYLALELCNYARFNMLPPHDSKSFIQVIDAQINEERGFRQNISLIEMSGENLIAFALKEEPKCLEDLGIGAADILLNNNKKVLFFVIGPSDEKEMWVDTTGKPIKIKQSDVIKSILSVLQKSNKIMRRIDAIHFILTKADTLGDVIDRNIIQERLNKLGYSECIKYANAICLKFGINRQVGCGVGLYPFSLGKFMPGDVYEYDEADSLKILRSLLISPILPCVYGPPPPAGLLGRIINWFNN